MNVPTMIPWSPSEAAAVNEFLNSPVGKKWLGYLLLRKPRVDLSSTERAALSGAQVSGYEQFFIEIAGSRVSLSTESMSARPIDPTRD